jgi:ferredoxin
LLLPAFTFAFFPSLHRSTTIGSKPLQMTVIQASSIQERASMRKGSDSTTETIIDMNVYNLVNLDEICQQWMAVAMSASAMMPEGIYLQARNKDDIMTDTVKVEFLRKPNMGLGLELLELAGGREDGVGITIVSGIVPGGASDGSGILPGDSIIKIELRKTSQQQSNQGVQEKEDLFMVTTECFNYDKTVDAIMSLPPMTTIDESTETFVITVKRLRRKPKVQLSLQYPPEMKEQNLSLELFAGENLRRALLVRGVKLNDQLAKRFDSGGSGDCGAEGTCATCAVSIIDGSNILSPPGLQEQQIFVKHPRWRMACKTMVGYGMKEGQVTIRVNPRQWDR